MACTANKDISSDSAVSGAVSPSDSELARNPSKGPELLRASMKAVMLSLAGSQAGQLSSTAVVASCVGSPVSVAGPTSVSSPSASSWSDVQGAATDDEEEFCNTEALKGTW